MLDEAFFLNLSLLGLTLAGFVGLTAALHCAGRTWLPQEIVGIKLVLEFSLGASFFALLPILFSQSLRDTALVWRVCSILLALFLAFELDVQRRRIRRLFRSGYPPRAPVFALGLLFPGTILALVGQLANVAWWADQAAYMWALAWLLTAPGLELFVFIYLSVRSGV